MTSDSFHDEMAGKVVGGLKRAVGSCLEFLFFPAAMPKKKHKSIRGVSPMSISHLDETKQSYDLFHTWVETIQLGLVMMMALT